MKPKRDPIEITVEWNEERHTLCVPLRKWRKIEDGMPLVVRGKGYCYEGNFFIDRWIFNESDVGTLRVEYGEDGGVGFDGLLSDAEIVYPQSDAATIAGSLGRDGNVSDLLVSGAEIDWEASDKTGISFSDLLEKAVETGIWVRKEDLPDVTSGLLIEEGYINDEDRLAELKKGGPTAAEVSEYIERFVENALLGNADSDSIPAYAIAPLKNSSGGELFALLISFGYSFTKVRTKLVRLFGSVEEAKDFMRSDGFI